MVESSLPFLQNQKLAIATEILKLVKLCFLISSLLNLNYCIMPDNLISSRLYSGAQFALPKPRIVGFTFRTWEIIALHKFLSIVALSKFCLFVISPNPRSAKHLRNLIRYFFCCFHLYLCLQYIL